MEGRFKRKGTYIYLCLIHIVLWQKPTQCCKAISNYPPIKTFFKKGRAPKFANHLPKWHRVEIHGTEPGRRKDVSILLLHGKATEEDIEESQIRGPRVEQREGGEGPRKHISLMTGALLSNL